MVHHEALLFTVAEIFQFLAIDGGRLCHDIVLVIYVEVLRASSSDALRMTRALTCVRNMESSEGVDYFAGGVGARGAGQAVAGVGGGAAEEEVADGSSVASPI